VVHGGGRAALVEAMAALCVGGHFGAVDLWWRGFAGGTWVLAAGSQPAIAACVTAASGSARLRRGDWGYSCDWPYDYYSTVLKHDR